MEPIEKLNQSMEKYKAIQVKQLSSFENELLPDIDSLNFERASAFAELKNNLDHFLNFRHSENTISLIEFYQKALGNILGTDKILMEKITEYKNDLKQHMREISNNKISIQKYAKSIKPVNPKTICFSG